MTARRNHLRLRAVDIFMRNWLVVAPVGVVIVLLIDLTRAPDRAWTHAPFVSLILLNLYCFRRCIAYRRRAVQSGAGLASAYLQIVVFCTLAGTLWTAVTLVTTLVPAQRYGSFLAPTLIYGAVLMAPIRPAALLYTAAITVGDILSLPAHGAADHHMQILIAIYGLSATVLVFWYHGEFARSVCNELKLEEQGDIIGMLLHDFEEQGSDWLWETDADLHLCRPSERLRLLLGCDVSALTNLSLRHWLAVHRRRGIVGQEGFAILAESLKDRTPFRDVQIPVACTGEERWLLLTGKPVLDKDGVFRGYRGVGSDITRSHHSEQQIAWLARHDSLTGLPNRAHFHEQLQTACERQGDTGQKLALLSLDLDGFKAVNDTLGHSAGDLLLAEVAARLRCTARERDLIGRLGGDEFAVLLADCDRAGAAALAERLIAQVAAPYRLDGQAAGIGVSIGIVMAPEDAVDAKELLKGADLAMYRAKQDGRGTIRFFDATMQHAHERKLMLQTDLRQAIAQDELVLHFQPILHGGSERVVAAEALVRWMHPTRGLIQPAEFIPIAEESGLIVALGTWVLRRACIEAAGWSSEVGVSVNLSPIQLRDPELPRLVEAALAESGLPAGRLELEITESLFLETSPVVRESLRCLKQRGIRVALDDFGTGFSSLSYLRDFQVDTVKIDRSFVRDLGGDMEADMIVQAITLIANGLGITITAEGVETADQAAWLRDSGCTLFQGFLYSRPCTTGALARFISDQNSTTVTIDAGPADGMMALVGPDRTREPAMCQAPA